jgi:chaperonin GroEL
VTPWCDGTSTSTLLAHAILCEGIRNIAAGASGVELKRGLDRGLRAAVGALKQLSRPVQGLVEKTHVATISAHNDPVIGKLVAEAFEKIGAEGVITVEEARTTETVLDIVEGMQFDRGFISPYFGTDPQKMEAVLEDPLILLYEKRLTNMKDLLPLLEQVARNSRPLLIIAEEVEGEALATLVVNKIRGTLACCAVKAPGFGDRRKAILHDLAILTGGQLIAEELGVKLENVTEKDLGQAKRVVIDKDTTTIVGGGGSKTAIAGAVLSCAVKSKRPLRIYDKEKTARTSGQARRRRGRDSRGCAFGGGNEEPQGGV